MTTTKTKRAQTNRLKWLEEKLNKLDLTGRDELYTHLITQEIPFWIQDLKRGKKIGREEIISVVTTRGFNKEETVKLKKLVKLLNANSRKIMESFKDLKLSLKDFLKEVQGELKHYEDKTLFKEQWLEIVRREVRE